jgi:hypothetical protein
MHLSALAALHRDREHWQLKDISSGDQIRGRGSLSWNDIKGEYLSYFEAIFKKSGGYSLGTTVRWFFGAK